MYIKRNLETLKRHPRTFSERKGYISRVVKGLPTFPIMNCLAYSNARLLISRKTAFFALQTHSAKQLPFTSMLGVTTNMGGGSNVKSKRS